MRTANEIELYWHAIAMYAGSAAFSVGQALPPDAIVHPKSRQLADLSRRLFRAAL